VEDTRIEQARMALRVTFGVIPILAGFDKFLNSLTHWEQYVSPLVTLSEHLPAQCPWVIHCGTRQRFSVASPGPPR
jgi:hypothetical protein